MENIKKSNFIVGGVVRDDDYFFHKAYEDEIWDLLQKNNILLLSPRRTGKTSLMYRLIDKPQHNYEVVHLNVEALTGHADFYIHLLDALYELQPKYLKTILQGWDFFKGLFCHIENVEVNSFKIALRKHVDWEKDWKKVSETLMSSIAKSNKKILFIIDEFPDMLSAMLQKDKEETTAFLHHFRAIRLNPNINNIRWLIGGSVHISGVLDEENLINTINDFHSESLPSISKDEVDIFIESMLSSRGVVFNQSIFETIRNLLGEPMPYFLQLFTQELYRYWRREKNNIKKIDTKEVHEVFNKHLLGETAHDKLQHYYSRIKLHYPNELQEIAHKILDVLSQSDSGISEAQLYSQYSNYQRDKGHYVQTDTDEHQTKRAFKNLMLRLDSDFYTWKNDDAIYNFKIHLIKIWWRKNWTQL